jgi:hypothetical protein
MDGASPWQSIRRLLPVAAVLALTACGQAPISLDRSFWESRGTPVGVAVSTLPEAGGTSAHDGRGAGLLDIAISRAMLSRMTPAMAAANTAPLRELQQRIGKILADRGMKPVLLEEPLALETLGGGAGPSDNKADRNYAPVAAKLGVDYLLVIDISAFGAVREFHVFLPTSEARGYSALMGQLVDVRTGGLLWYKRLEVIRPTVGPWDQPPDFPNLVQAANRAISASASLLLSDFTFFAR